MSTTKQHLFRPAPNRVYRTASAWGVDARGSGGNYHVPATEGIETWNVQQTERIVHPVSRCGRPLTSVDSGSTHDKTLRVCASCAPAEARKRRLERSPQSRRMEPVPERDWPPCSTCWEVDCPGHGTGS